MKASFELSEEMRPNPPVRKMKWRLGKPALMVLRNLWTPQLTRSKLLVTVLCYHGIRTTKYMQLKDILKHVDEDLHVTKNSNKTSCT